MPHDHPSPDGDADLGALMARVLPHLAALEAPVLGEAGLSMWEYAIITELATDSGLSQVELSRRTGRDPTRLGRHLDELTSRGLVERGGSGDRRRRTASLTDAGRRLHRTTKERVRAVEDGFLDSRLGPPDQDRLRRLLARLAQDLRPHT